jgi:hypothetical protein
MRGEGLLRRPGKLRLDGCKVVMDQSTIQAKLRQSIGQAVRVRFGGHSETVLVISVDSDGFICRIQPASPEETTTEFWVAYREVSSVT